MTVELLSAIAGVILSLLFSYVPGLHTWYDKLTADTKRLVMLAVLAFTAGAIYGFSCAGIYNLVPCTRDGLIALVEIFVMALIANQSTYLITPRTHSETAGEAYGLER